MTDEVFKIAQTLHKDKKDYVKKLENNEKVASHLEKYKDVNKSSWFTIWDGQTCYYDKDLMLEFLNKQHLRYEKELKKIEEELEDL